MKRLIAPSLIAVLAVAMLVQLALAIGDRTSAYEWFDPIVDIRGILMRDFVREPDAERMQREMITAMIETLEDPHTTWVPPAREADFNKELRGTYVGIGAEVNIIDDYLTIISPMDGSPALDAGVLAGDVVTEIEGESTFQMPIDECIDRLMGEPNTQVTFRVRHVDGTEEDITITRRQIVTRTVRGVRRIGEEWSYCVDEDLGLSYIRITQFTGSTLGELQQVLEELRGNQLNGLVLDLRDNPGGALRAAVEMSDLFLDSGVIVSVRGRNEQENRTFEASSPGTLPAFPMVVLLNGASASASEIVAGALQENGRAKVLGTRSFGKGSVQEIRELDFGRGTLKYTAAYYYLPGGRNLHRIDGATVWGVDPDPGLVVPVTDEEYVARFRAQRELEIIREQNGEIEPCVTPEWIREHELDEQFALAVEVLRERVAGDPWRMVSDAESADVAVNTELEREAEIRSRILEQLHRSNERIQRLQGVADAIDVKMLVPDDVDLAGGEIELRDKLGNVVATFRLAGGDIETALRSLDLEPASQE